MAGNNVDNKQLWGIFKALIDGYSNDANRIKRDVRAVCKQVTRLLRFCQELLEEEGNSLKQHFIDIYCCLRCHMVFLLPDFETITPLTELVNLGRQIGVDQREMEKIPDAFWAIDPGGRILKIISEAMGRTESPQGSEAHASSVMTLARVIFGELRSDNIFRPQVLAKVSCNGKWYVGSSMAVSHVLIPLCLHQRIRDFHCSLKKATINFGSQRLDDANNHKWLSSAFHGKDYQQDIPPCMNCEEMFRNLKGFISKNDGNNKGKDTILAACAEYCPISQLLQDNGQELSKFDEAALARNWGQCAILFQEFQNILDDFDCAEKSGREELMNRFVWKRKHMLYIFGLKPELNDKF